MGWEYQKVVVIGATSGIGEALAHRFVESGSKVVAVGRRQDRLDALVQRHGPGTVSTVAFDICDVEGIPPFVAALARDHGDIDCVVLNSGIQRKANFADPQSVDMKLINQEMTVNYLAPLALTKAFLPHLQSKTTPSCLVYTTSGLALVPIPRCANYCASKAAMHHFILCLREQLKDTSVKVVELIPPAVQTELHDAKNQPDLGRPMGMPLDEFTNEAFAGLADGSEQIAVGTAKSAFQAFEIRRQQIFAGMVKAMSGGIPNMLKSMEGKP